MKTKTPEELKHLIGELKSWAPNDMEPHLKVVHSAALIKEALDAIEFLTGPPILVWDRPDPEIIAKEEFVAAVPSNPWPRMMEIEVKLEQLADRVTTHNEDRYQQTRSTRDEMLRVHGILWNRLIFLAIGWAITTVILLYEISKDAPVKPTTSQMKDRHEEMDRNRGADPPGQRLPTNSN